MELNWIRIVAAISKKASNTRMEDELKAHLEAMEARLDAKIEKVETTLLTEFHKWASPAELRARSHAAANADILYSDF